MVVDRYDRDFRLNVAALSSVRDDKARARQILHRWSQESTADILSEGLGYRLLSYRHAGYSTAGDVEPALGFDTPRLAITTRYGWATTLGQHPILMRSIGCRKTTLQRLQGPRGIKV